MSERLSARFLLERRLTPFGARLSELWEATDQASGRRVCVKRLAPSFRRDPTAVALMHSEITRLQKLQSLELPTIIRLVAYDLSDSDPFLVMEYIGGGSLADLLPEKPVRTISEAKAILDGLYPLAETLDAMHRENIVHGDVKPENVLKAPHGLLVLCDLGAGGGETDASKFVVFLSPFYSSPEQAAGRQPVPASDQYSFAVMLYQLLTGRLPFAGSRDEVLEAHRTDSPPSPEFGGDLAGLNGVLLKGLEKRPSNRHGSVAELLRAAQFSLESAGFFDGGATQPLPADGSTIVTAERMERTPGLSKTLPRLLEALTFRHVLSALKSATWSAGEVLEWLSWNLLIGMWFWLFVLGDTKMSFSRRLAKAGACFGSTFGLLVLLFVTLSGVYPGLLSTSALGALGVAMLVIYCRLHPFRALDLSPRRPWSDPSGQQVMIMFAVSLGMPLSLLTLIVLRFHAYSTNWLTLFPVRVLCLAGAIFLLGMVLTPSSLPGSFGHGAFGRSLLQVSPESLRSLFMNPPLLLACLICLSGAYLSSVIPAGLLVAAIWLAVLAVENFRLLLPPSQIAAE